MCSSATNRNVNCNAVSSTDFKYNLLRNNHECLPFLLSYVQLFQILQVAEGEKMLYNDEVIAIDPVVS